MKRKSLTVITLALMVFGVSACGAKNTTGHHYTENFLYDENKHWRECTDDGCVQQVDVAIHEFLDWTVVEEATCGKVGREISKCSTCDYVLEREIPIKDHDVEEGWVNDEEYHWHTCKNDPQEKVDYNAHSFNWVYSTEPTCLTAGRGHQECTVCGFKLAEQDIPALNHDWVLDEEHTTYATCDNDGVVTHVCSICGETETKIVKAGHNWGDPTYEWSADYSKVTATRVCENNADHVETETVFTDYVHVSPTCEKQGSNTYTTKAFKNSGFKQQTKVFPLETCSETLEHHCEVEKYTGGEIYDECTICHKKYNVRECEQPWVDYYFPTELEQAEESDNGAGEYASFDEDSKTAILPKHSGSSAKLTFKGEGSIPESEGKNYFVLTYTLMKDSGGWWDTYVDVVGMGTSSRIRFGKIDASAVQSFDMTKATFIKNGEVVGWNSVSVGETGTLILDITGVVNGVSSISLYSDGGVELRIDNAGFRSAHCEHDISCYEDKIGYTCAGLITTTYSECEECHHKVNEVTSGLPMGYSSLDLGNPVGVRWSSSCYDYVNHVITVPNTYSPGPMFENVNGKKMIAEVTLDWDENVTDATNANFQFYFMNNELTDEFPDDNMYNHFYQIKAYTGGLQGANAGLTNPAALSDVARLLDDSTGEEISSFEKGEKIVLEINVGNASIKDFARFLICGTNGTVITIHNVIYS